MNDTAIMKPVNERGASGAAEDDEMQLADMSENRIQWNEVWSPQI
jgi:hypothetical protein